MTKLSAKRNSQTSIIIVGAGPGGASLAIRLAKENFRVVLIEREKFPRHKLCGEFVSPECLAHFSELGVLEQMLEIGGDRITETVFYAPDGKSVSVPSRWFDGKALSISRAEMDFRLIKSARELGVEVLEETQVTGVLSENGDIRGVKVRTKDGELKEISGDLTIDATGRANVLARLVEKKSLSKKASGRSQSAKLVGFKTHLENVGLAGGMCEIYFFRGGYGGLSYVENNRANHCFLINAETVKEFAGDADKIVEKVIFRNARALKTMRHAKPLFDWLAVSVNGFGQKNLNPAKNLFTVGDAAAFIDPFTGSGMLMALESAEILARSISANALFPNKIEQDYEILHRKKFQKRLRVCSILRQAAFIPHFAGIAISALSLSRTACEILARSTRQTFSINKNKL